MSSRGKARLFRGCDQTRDAYKEYAEIDIIPETANAIRPRARQEVKAPRGEGMLE